MAAGSRTLNGPAPERESEPTKNCPSLPPGGLAKNSSVLALPVKLPETLVLPGLVVFGLSVALVSVGAGCELFPPESTMPFPPLEKIEFRLIRFCVVAASNKITPSRVLPAIRLPSPKPATDLVERGASLKLNSLPGIWNRRASGEIHANN